MRAVCKKNASTKAAVPTPGKPPILPAPLESTAMSQAFDVCIRGAGIVGRTLALLLARERLKVAISQSDTPPAADQTTAGTPSPDPVGASAVAASDVRAYALNAASRTLLQSLRGWPDATASDARQPPVTEVLGMQVFGDDGSRVTFGDVNRRAAVAPSPIGQDPQALAWIVDVPTLEQQLADALRYQSLVERVEAPVAAPLTVICEGRIGASMGSLAVESDVASYDQFAIATRVRCEKPHDQIARQWFEDGQILALLPLGGADGHEAAVVWSVDEAQRPVLMALDAADFAERVRQASHDALGWLELTHERTSWPLQLAQAQRWIGRFADDTSKKPRAWAIAGDAAHSVHPLAGQGLNLGLADAAALAECLRDRDYWRSVGDPRLLRRYERSRKAGLVPMRAATDGLQRLFAHDNDTVKTLRNWGLRGFERSGPLKTWAVRQAMGL